MDKHKKAQDWLIIRKILILLPFMILLIGCSASKKELYKETDKFVQSLEKEYQSYGTFGGFKHAVTTSDGLYTITPIGRLINVKIQKIADTDEYKSLRKDLEDHYKKDLRVKDVYISKGGTIMIDCRN